MKNLLLTFGCSFTYGEGLEFYYWKENFPKSFDLYKNKMTYFPSSLIMISLDDLVHYREKNRYSGILKNFLNFTLMTKGDNGGCNYRNIEMMEIYIKYLKAETDYSPKYCVFQLTNIIRDIVEFCHSDSFGPHDDGIRWLGADMKKQLIENINQLDNPMRKHNLNNDIAEVFKIIIEKLMIQFKELESLGCKCIFFNGVDDFYSHYLIADYLKQNPYYLPITFNGNEYRSWDAMNKDSYLTIRQNIGVFDDHPCLDSHKWLANILYKKYLELIK